MEVIGFVCYLSLVMCISSLLCGSWVFFYVACGFFLYVVCYSFGVVEFGCTVDMVQILQFIIGTKNLVVHIIFCYQSS